MKKIFFLWVCTLFLAQSCKTAVTTASEAVPSSTASKDASVYLKVLGTEPFWNLAFSPREIVYTTLDNETLVFPAVEPVRAMDANIKKYRTHKDGYSLEATISAAACSDGMSDTEYAYKAEVKITKNGKVVLDQNGCGTYLLNEQLAGKWTLTEINKKPLPKTHEYVTPYLEFDTEANAVSGNASCNGLVAQVFSEGTTIRFSHMALTRMFCVHENIEQEFSSTLSNITRYELQGKTLRLYSDDQLRMVFTQ